MNEPDVTAALEHYSWLFFQLAVDTYGWTDERTWEAFEVWLHREGQ